MPYQSTDTLKKQVDAILKSGSGSSYASGLASAIKGMAANRINNKIGDIEARNETNRAQELASLLKGAQGNDPAAFETPYTDPEVQKLAAQLRIKQATEKGSGYSRSPITLYNQSTKQYGIGTIGDEGISITPSPEGWSVVPDAGRMGLNPDIVAGMTPTKADQAGAVTAAQEEARTTAELERIRKLTDPKARMAAMEALLKGQAENTVLAESGPIKTAIAGNTTAATTAASNTMDNYIKTEVPQAKAAMETSRYMDQFLKASEGAPEGSLQPLLTGFQNLMASLGANPSKLEPSILAEQAQAGTLASYMKSLGARGLTDADMAVLARVGPQLSTSKAARDAVAKVLKDASERTLDQFDKLDTELRKGPAKDYLTPIPFMDEWRKSKQPAGSRFEIIKNG